jgi:hypothetical protein
VRVSSEFDSSGAPQKHTGDDLQAIGDPVLHLMQQGRVLPQQVVLDPFGETGVDDVGDGQEQPNRPFHQAVELLSPQNQASRLAAFAQEIHFVGFDIRIARERDVEQGFQARNVPFSRREFEDFATRQVRWIDLKRSAERRAGGDDVQLSIQKQKGATDEVTIAIASALAASGWIEAGADMDLWLL